MSKVVPFKSPASRARVAAMASKALAGLQQADLDAEAARERKDKQRAALVAKLEIAMREVCKANDKVTLARAELALAVGEDSARTYCQLVESKVHLDYGIVRVL